VDAGTRWIPLTTVGGAPLTPAQQVSQTLSAQPLPGGRRLLTSFTSTHDYRFVLQDSTGARVRGWRLTSQTTLGGLVAPPTLVGDDLVVVVDVNSQDGPGYRSEYEVVRVSASGTVLSAFAIDARAAWGDVITPVRVGPDGALYALVSAPSDGARVVRYPLAPTAVPATPSQTGTGTAGTPGGAATTPATAAPAHGGTSAGANPSGGSPVIWVLGAAAAAALAGGAGWYRFHHGRA
jgi:hypothetical protein